MKKSIILFIIILIVGLLSGCMPTSPSENVDLIEFSLSNVLDLDFTTIESLRLSEPYALEDDTFTFEVKDIERAEDRSKVYDMLKSIDFVEIEKPEQDGAFQGLIDITGEDQVIIIIMNGILIINNSNYYTASTDIKVEFDKLYSEMDYEPTILK